MAFFFQLAPSITTTTSLPPVTRKTLHTQGESTSSKDLEPTPTTDETNDERGKRHTKGNTPKSSI